MRGIRGLLMLVLSVGAGLAAVAMVNHDEAAPSAAQPTAGQVVVTTRDLQLGEPLDKAALKAIAWPTDAVPPGSFRTVAEVEGRVLKTVMLRGEPVLDPKLAPVGTKGGLSAVIDQGKRAITVKVNEVVGVAGFALPGNFVDVLVSTRDEGDKPVSKIVLERILVLAVAQESGRDDTKPRVVSAVTLEVSPDQAEHLDLARSIGTLSLVLRNQVDTVATATDGARKHDLLAGMSGQRKPAAPATPAAAPAPRKPKAAPVAASPAEERIEVIRGVQRSEASL